MWGDWLTASSFFGGMILVAVIGNVIPSAENPHETHTEEETAPLHDPQVALPDFQTAAYQNPAQRLPGAHDHAKPHAGLLRTGLFTALVITILNFPEGIAIFLAAVQEPALGVASALAIELHNIPEGISISVPIFYATGNRNPFCIRLPAALPNRLGR